MAELLYVDQLTAGYGEAVILNQIGFSLAAGETLALLGRNGTGKTTLINTLAGATRQHAGSITLDGLALHRLASHARAAAGVGVFYLFRHLDAAAGRVSRHHVGSGLRRRGHGAVPVRRHDARHQSGQAA